MNSNCENNNRLSQLTQYQHGQTQLMLAGDLMLVVNWL